MGTTKKRKRRRPSSLPRPKWIVVGQRWPTRIKVYPMRYRGRIRWVTIPENENNAEGEGAR